MITLHNVYKHYPPNQTALNNIDLKVGHGDFLFIAGASGAGKSTLLRLFYGEERASSGTVVIGGRNLASADARGIASLRREMGIIFQDYQLLHRRPVVDNVAFGLEVMGVPLKQRRELAMKLLHSLGLAEKAFASPVTLSGGEQQRVAIARALLHRPKFILADEPTGNLDREMTWVVFDLLLEAHAAGSTVIVATHDLALIEELNLRTIVLDRGKIIGDFDSMQRLD
jgi:cell division transport system ATP-binding protein